jgi:hypothetical protein
MKHVFLLSVALLMAFDAGAVSVMAQTSQSSGNFQNVGTGVIPAQFSQTSSNYRIDAAIEPVVGMGQSTNYTVEVGTQVRPGTVTTPSPAAGVPAGGSGGLPPIAPEDLLLTLEYRSPTYQNSQKILGKRDSNIFAVMVNGSSNNVFYEGQTWYTTLPLFLGMNSISVQGTASNGLSKILTGAIGRLLIGDCNRDGRVDDADLSFLVRTWGKAEFRADFNEDDVVDDVDLSLLVSHWGMTY